MELCVYKLFFYTVAGRQFGDASSLQTGSLHFQNKRNMEFYASGKKKFYLPKSNYQPNIDAGLLAHVREEVFKREEEQRKQREVDEAKKTEDEKRTKLGRQIHSIVPNLPITYQEKMTADVINSLALSLMDGTVFEIVRGLEDIQQLTERNLLNKRMKLINSQKAERMEQNKTHKAAIDACSNKPHHLPVVRKKHTQEKENLESRLEQELVQLDQKLVLELDRVVADQQTTMQRAGVPMFHLTNDSTEIQLQMYILDIVTKISGS